MTGRVTQLAALPALVVAVVLNIIHPFIHPLEGGTLDMVLGYVTAAAAQLAQYRSVQ